jgi:hypothetical protein
MCVGMTMRGAKPRSPRLADPSAPPTGDVRTDIQFPPVDVMHLPSPSVAAYRGLIVALMLADQRLASGVHPQRAYIDALSAVSQFVGSDVLRRRPAGRHRSGQIGPHRPYSPARHWTRADALPSRVITRIVRRDDESGRCNGSNRPNKRRTSSPHIPSSTATSIHVDINLQPMPMGRSGRTLSKSGTRRHAPNTRRDTDYLGSMLPTRG